MIILIAYFKPYNDRTLNNLELFNEVIIQSILYNMIAFSDNYEIEPKLKMKIGFVPIALSVLFLVVNIYVIMSQKMIDFVKNIYKKLCKKKKGNNCSDLDHSKIIILDQKYSVNSFYESTKFFDENSNL